MNSSDQPFKKMRSLNNSIDPNFESYSSDKENYNVLDKISDDEGSDLDVASENSEVFKGFQKKLQKVTNLKISDTIDPISMKYYFKSLATEQKVKKYNLIFTDVKADKV